MVAQPENAVGSAPHITVRPLSVHIGAEIDGVDLATPLDAAAVDAIWAALLQWKVVFFRGQTLDHAAHVRLARRFGTPTPGHVVFGSEDDYPEVYSIAKHRAANSGHGVPMVRPWTGWHTDITAALNPPGQSILRGDVVPPYGGDTQWTNLAVAYQSLSATMRNFIDGLRGIHKFSSLTGGNESSDYRERIDRRTLVTEHPLVRVHPETGERVLYVSPGFLKSIAGLSPRESQGLMEILWEHAVRTEYTVRFRWEPGCVAFWDNRSTAHLAPTDVFATDFDRQFWRVTLLGEVPVGPDGRESVAIEGDPIEPQPLYPLPE